MGTYSEYKVSLETTEYEVAIMNSTCELGVKEALISPYLLLYTATYRSQ